MNGLINDPAKEILYNSKKSEEVQTIIDRMPVYWVKWIALVIGCFIGTIILLGFIIKYPETVDGQISITASIAPVRMVSKVDSRIILLKPNKYKIHKGDVISYLETGANYRHILQLDSLLTKINLKQVRQKKLPDSLILGEISSNYNAFAISYYKYDRLLSSNIYITMCENLQKQIFADEKMLINLQRELNVKELIVKRTGEQLQKDSVLMGLKGISEQEYKEKSNAFLSLYEAKINIESSMLLKQSEISKNNLEIQRIKLQEIEDKDAAFSELNSQENALMNAINIWKEKYLQCAPIDGELEYLGFWRNNNFISSGEELFSILPDKNDIIGEVKLPSFGVGKVEIGQNANVKINNYPYDEYGLLKGVVRSVSRTTNKMESTSGLIDVYLVQISFPNGIKTNFGKELPFDFELKGTVEIITKPKRLIFRLFDNLKSQSEK